MTPNAAHTSRVHFWTDRPVEDARGWNPDLEPHLYATGYGHAFLEPYARLRDSGYSVTLGRRAPLTATVIVASLEELTNWLPFCEPSMVRALAREVLRTQAPLVVIRGDVHPEILAPRFTVAEIVPTQRAVLDPGRHVYLPLLPQRGLIERDVRRGTDIQTAVLKAYAKNVPPWLDADFVQAADDLGVVVRVDDETASTRRWEDFSDVDVAICSQPMQELRNETRKPPTKLVNAWRAGAIPVVVPMLPYAEIGSDGVNMLVASGAEDLLQALRRLGSDIQLRRQLFSGARLAGEPYHPDVLTRTWWHTLATTPRNPGTLRAATASLAFETLQAARRKAFRTSLHARA